MGKIVPRSTYTPRDAGYRRVFGPGLVLQSVLGKIRVGGRTGGGLTPLNGTNEEYACDMYFRAPASGALTAFRTVWPWAVGGNTEYAAGNGGTMDCKVYPDDGTGKPNFSGTVFSEAIYNPGLTGDGVGNATTNFFQVTLTSNTPLVAGDPYHLVIVNTAANATANKSSVDCAVTAEGVEDDGCPWFSPDSWGAQYMYRPTGGSGSWNYYDWGRTVSGEGWWFRPSLLLTIGGVVHGHYRTSGGSLTTPTEDRMYRALGSANPVRQRFTPPTSMKFSGFSIHTAKNSGSGALGWELKQGSTVIASGTIADTGNDFSAVQHESTIYFGVLGWRDVAFSGSVRLAASTVYDLEFTPQGTSTWSFCCDEIPTGVSSDVYYQYGQYYNGSTWIGANIWDHSSSGGTDFPWRIVWHRPPRDTSMMLGC